ncbi:hypothetical protein [Staphylococcus agnetis]|uniref:hypothetical protein n=1 Tax=Staphylococcus agnetis TaxID=985762 RepID=UPI0004E39E16|nr:hypothetical protein [Staphylococcus agnetis]KFE42804.1 hypothetical protein SAGN_00785 [Staphylococcus agnetis]PTH46413.1 hypothetical protein BU587_09495 [Staphylococcus agnetis]PTH72182.1 hypothetical protein BU580_09775 [Staphylococcus agnetis]PTH74077.1 hypothetical protein BU581_02450 [Staphylococcus agnetis]
MMTHILKNKFWLSSFSAIITLSIMTPMSTFTQAQSIGAFGIALIFLVTKFIIFYFTFRMIYSIAFSWVNQKDND